MAWFWRGREMTKEQIANIIGKKAVDDIEHKVNTSCQVVFGDVSIRK